MNVEFLEDGPILLSHGTSEEVRRLRESLRPLSSAIGCRVSITRLPFVNARDGVSLDAIAAERDVGVRELDPKQVEWLLYPESWTTVDGLLEPFSGVDSASGFQFLNPTGDRDVIYSVNGSW